MAALRGPGGAPVRASTFPTDPEERKRHPVASGVLDYFPDALIAVARVSWAGNEQHNPGLDLRWTRGKSGDEADALIRHFLERGTLDTDGMRHSAKMAWRALALLQKEIEAAQAMEGVKGCPDVLKGVGAVREEIRRTQARTQERLGQRASGLDGPWLSEGPAGESPL
jgi:hypothetical protein